jgi:hypothetical protein
MTTQDPQNPLSVVRTSSRAPLRRCRLRNGNSVEVPASTRTIGDGTATVRPQETSSSRSPPPAGVREGSRQPMTTSAGTTRYSAGKEEEKQGIEGL